MTARLPAATQSRRQVPIGCPLSNAEFKVIGLFGDGLTRKQAGRRLGVSPSTVRSQADSAYRRLGVTGSTQAVIMCFKSGWLRVDGLPAPRPLPGAAAEKLTPRQQLYLLAFDLHLRSRGDDQLIASRQLMDRALGGMLEQAQVTVRPGRRPRDLVELLMRVYQR